MSEHATPGFLRSEITLDLLNRRGVGHFPGLIGVEILALEEGRLTSRLRVRPDLMAPNGFLHAATVVGLADTTCGYGTVAHLPAGARSFTTIELKSNFLGTAREGYILCEARAEHLGRTTQVLDARVSSESGAGMALFRCSQMILWPR